MYKHKSVCLCLGSKTISAIAKRTRGPQVNAREWESEL